MSHYLPFDPGPLPALAGRRLHGIGLEAGQVVLSGSFIRPIDVARGDTIHADYGPLGTVSCHFR